MATGVRSAGLAALVLGTVVLARAAPPIAPALPTLTIGLADGTVVGTGEVLEFTVTATWPRSASIRISLLNPPPGCIFTEGPRSLPTPAGNVATGRVRWLVPDNVKGRVNLTFRAADAKNPSSALLRSIQLRSAGDWFNFGACNAIVVGDVSDDAAKGLGA